MSHSINEQDLALYHFMMCPYCMMVRREIDKLGLNIEQKDIRLEREAYEELIQGGGSRTVPCLRIKQEDGSFVWMYESSDIVNYLRKQFA